MQTTNESQVSCNCWEIDGESFLDSYFVGRKCWALARAHVMRRWFGEPQTALCTRTRISMNLPKFVYKFCANYLIIELVKNCLRHLESCFLKLAIKLQKVCGHLKYVSCQSLDLPSNENIWTQCKIQDCEKGQYFQQFCFGGEMPDFEVLQWHTHFDLQLTTWHHWKDKVQVRPAV